MHSVAIAREQCTPDSEIASGVPSVRIRQSPTQKLRRQTLFATAQTAFPNISRTF